MANKQSTQRSVSGYGWQPDLPDNRDFMYAAIMGVKKKLPSSVDLRSQCPAQVYDQGQLGSCTANSIAGAFEFELLKQSSPDFMPSRLFIYYNERVLENTVNTDAGAQIRDGIKTVNAQGVCPEDLWPYSITEFTQKPHLACYTDALTHLVTSYHRIATDITQMKSCLADGYPFVFGFTVYDGFESPQVAKSGILNMPATGEKVVGGHAVLAVGYDDAKKMIIVRNSWGSGWGLNGYFMMPYAYISNPNLADDFWTIRLVENNPAMKKPKK